MGLGSMFGSGSSTPDNSGAFAKYGDAMWARAPTYSPWVEAGTAARDRLQGEYGKLVDNPNWLQDQVSAGFYESPYQKYMQDMVTKRMNYNATNTGMLGSGAAQRALQDELTKMTGQFQNDYINRGISSYGQGLTGYQGLADMGFKALGAQNDLIEQAEGAFLKGEMSKNAYDAANETDWGSLIGTVGGGIAGGMFGGPMGAMSGAQAGKSLFGGGGGARSGGMGGMFPMQSGGGGPNFGSGGGSPAFNNYFNTGNWSYR